MKEEWKIIENYEEYQISTLGRVKSLKHNKERLLRLSKNSKRGGYMYVRLCKNGKST